MAPVQLRQRLRGGLQMDGVAAGRGLTLSLLLLMEEVARSLAVHVVVGRAVKQHLFLQVQDLVGLLHGIS